MSRQVLAISHRLRECAKSENTSVQEVRGLLSMLVEKLLTNTETVASTISRVGEASEFVSTLQLISWYAGRNPAVFVHGGSVYSDDEQAGATEPTDQENESHAFTCWYFARILRLLAHKGCRSLHEICRDTITQVLLVIKWRDLFAFHNILTELVDCIAELVQISDHLDKAKVKGKRIKEILKSFSVPSAMLKKSLTDPLKASKEQPVNLSDMPHVISSLESCETLQINVTHILDGFVSDICQFADHKTKVLWASLCCQLEFADFPLKSVSILAMVKLIERNGLPTGQVLVYFISCHIALLQKLCEDRKKTDSVQEADYLEECTAKLCDQFVVENSSSVSITKIPLVDLRLYYDKVALMLGKHGLHNLQRSDLKNAVGRFSCHLMEKLPSNMLIGRETIRQRFIQGLLKDIGTVSEIQGVVGPLVKCIQSEMHKKTETSKSDAAAESDQPMAEDESDGGKKGKKLSKSRAKKRKASDVDERPDIEGSSKTFRSLYVKLRDSLCRMSERDITLADLEAVKVFTQVASHCILLQPTNTTSGSSPLTFWNFCTESDMCQILSLWQIFLEQQVPSLDFATLNTGLQKMADCISGFLTLHVSDSSTFRTEHFHAFGWISSIVWLPAESHWLDLVPEGRRKVAEMSTILSRKIDVPTVDKCLQCLSYFPKSFMAKWRARVLGLALSDARCDVKISALTNLPMFLCTLGTNTAYLITELVHPLLSETSTTESRRVQEMIAEKLGDVACVLSKHASVCLSPDEDINMPVSRCITVVCTGCSSTPNPDKTTEYMEKKFAPFEPQLMLPFLKLLTGESQEAKQKMVENLGQIFSHMTFKGSKNAAMTFLTTCLNLMEDPNYHTRRTFSQNLGKVMDGDRSQGSKTSTDQLIFNRVKDAYTKARAENDVRLQETILLTSGNLGKVCDGDRLLVVMINLLESMLSHTPQVAATAYLLLQDLAKSKGTKMQTLFMRFRQPICQFLANAMHDAHETPGCKDAQHVLQEVTNVLEFPDVKSFIQASKKYLLPFLVSKATQTASNVIKILATAMGKKSRKVILINNTQYIFSCLVRHFHGAELQKALHFLQKETEFELGSLLRFRFQQVHNELLLYLCTNYQQVFQGLRMLGSHDKDPREINTSAEMADFLQPRLLGFLAYFDVQLADTHVPIEDKKLALESLVSIMRLMGQKHITPVRLKVITTLRRSLELTEEGFPEISCRAWNCFVRSVDYQSLGPMLSQIIAALLSLMEKLPRQVAEIVNFLIVENRKVLHGHFHEIYFLPEITELSDANAVLKQYTEGPSSQSDVRSQISHFLKGVSHENLDIRLHALSKLRLLLQQHQSGIHKLIMGNETADPIISQLVSVLLTGCRESDQRARLLYGECLGELGAIDPGRLDLATNNPKKDPAHFHASVDDDNFAFDLINDVTRAFLAATEPDIQNCSALALQELLQIYNIGEDKWEGSSGQKLWKRFPEQTQEILLPLLSSKYVLQSTQDWSKLEKPIYGTKKGSKFKDWVTTWTGYLTSKVTEEKARKVFLSCAAQIKHDIHITLYLLPHVVVYVLLDGSEDDKKELNDEILEVISTVKKPDTRHGSASDFRHMSAQTVYSVFDHLNKWRQRRAQVIAAKAGNTKGDPAYLSDKSYQDVTKFLEGIPLDELAEASYNCQGYTRALMYFENYITSTKQNLQEHLDFLQQLYASMGEADGVQGVAAVRHSQPTLHEEILVHECTGQLTYALACYERAIQLEPSNISLHKGLLRNYMDLGQQSTALVQVSGILAERYDWVDQLNSYRVEAAWKLGSWSKLETFNTLEKQKRGWSVGLGRVLLAAKHRDDDEFLQQLKSLRGEQMGPLSAASMESGSYQRGYEHIVRLHMLNELEHGMKSLVGFPSDGEDCSFIAPPKSELLKQWEARLSMAQCSFRTQEPILTLRKTLFLLCHDKDDPTFLDTETGQIWLRVAKVARKAGHLQTSYSAMLQASNCSLTLQFQEKAKLLWTKGDHDQALAILEAGIAENFSNINTLKGDQSAEAKTKRSEYARALLLFGNYSEETSSMESNAIMKQYKEVIDAYQEWEDGHFYMARYYDKIMTTLIDERDRPEKQGEFTIYVVRFFGQSLRYGNQYIYQSMPRLLSLWLDYGSMVVEAEKKERGRSVQKLQTQRTILERLNKIVASLRQQLAPYQLFTALPQLISRICHTHADVSAQLQEIIASLLVAFPQQAMWMMMAVSKSSYPMRVKRCQEIFAKAKDMNTDLHKFILDATKLTERLLDLCEKEVPKMMPTLSMTQHFRPLRRLLEDSQFSLILMPLQDAMTVTLPSDKESLENHDPFPGQQVYIDGFEDTIEILPSLQKPKKITMKGSNGRLYVMMCKPKDDLRKDCRLMEFNGIVNKFLRRDPDSRRRQLHIRTYTVVPLNEECGLIEWVNNTSGLRYILIKLYREKCLYMSGKELQACMPALHNSIETKLNIYHTKLLVRHPPVFSEWFLRTFPDPTSWYSARLSYTRTTAVMSMVGYILGLGDRHGENILFDSTNGDCVHVDFNCLFNKGETFEWPEKVPFRLTPNMVEAMGPLGHEGLFRQACEVTLRVMRNQMDSLMSVLKPFVYDPLVEWSKPARGRSNPTDSGEITNEQAMTHVLNIEHRLKGILKSKTKARGLPLSIDGHVNYLIKEATDEKNMCQMYIGWAAYL